MTRWTTVLLGLGLLMGSAAPGWAAPPAPGKWRETFRETFNGPRLGERWQIAINTCNPGAAWREAAPKIAEGRFTFFYQPASPKKAMAKGLLASGGINTRDGFRLQYGYVECHVRVPAAWYHCTASLVSADGDASIVLFTSPPDAPGQVEGSVRQGGERTVVPLGVPGIDLAQGEHRIGVLWNPQGITWYLDGQVAGRTPVAPSAKMYLWFTFSAPTPLPDPPDVCLATPARFTIDEVRAYRNADDPDTAPPELLRVAPKKTVCWRDLGTAVRMADDGIARTYTHRKSYAALSAIHLFFDEPLDKACAEDITHYLVQSTGIRRIYPLADATEPVTPPRALIRQARLSADGKTVFLSLDPLEITTEHPVSVQLTITGVSDTAGNRAPSIGAHTRIEAPIVSGEVSQKL